MYVPYNVFITTSFSATKTIYDSVSNLDLSLKLENTLVEDRDLDFFSQSKRIFNTLIRTGKCSKNWKTKMYTNPTDIVD